ncbi:hypothetical protein GCM10025867_04450 [Frondihabitans sucicola]|uniref:Uncharacterized protein n=1 Tax=Frondihabitans sucicola TaxID=1268041 RepID=A0ABM8GIM6_9MICO|nr:hypothetical protein [Frondihabitans sucicola]BDZ48204.1 hypothetical protein GCM10025867_04450 [Frondihabitans sucicola]
MSESTTDDATRHEREEEEVREALLGDASERNTAWLFEQLGEPGIALLHDRDPRD